MSELLSNLLYSYGFVPMLCALEYFQEKEEFETCAEILVAIKKHGQALNFELPTKYSKEALDVLRDAFHKLGLTGKYAERNIPHYTQEIIEVVEAKNKEDLSQFNKSLEKALNFNPKK